MNFLAHIYLSGGDHKLMIGNFIGDFVKGGDLKGRYDLQIIKGIELHRAIDQYTDSHEVVQKSKDRLRPKYRHYSGVIVDMYYDHFLARNWGDFHHVPLSLFADQFYELLKKNEVILPENVRHLMPYLIQGNWLVNYSKTEGIHQALSGMSRRTPYDSKMDEAVGDLTRDYKSFENEFNNFFPKLNEFCKTWIQTH